MKKLPFAFFILAIFLVIACQNNEDEIIGSDIIVTEDRSLSNFQNIDNNSIINTNITYGEFQSVQVKANDNIIKNVITEVSNNTLFINLENGNYQNISINIDIVLPDFTKIHNEGTGNINIIDFENLSNVAIESIGTGNISAKGEADDLSIELIGTGNFNGFEFITKTTSVLLTGTGNIEVFCSENLNGSLTGTGNLYYKGNPAIDVSVMGTGNIINAN